MVRGTMVIRPYGYAIWEGIQKGLDARIKHTGHKNLYFPLFIPYKLLEKESEHLEGFIPQVAIVTQAGGETLDEPLVVRPTSETLIWATYARWIQSYRDLPLLYNQWANVVRWEMRTRLFLRTTEFLWQEGHTAHESSEEAVAEARRILLEVYRATVEEDLAIPVLYGRKTEAERFPGAVETLCIEALMRDRKALQAGTSHYLGQNFSRAYDVKFLGRDGKEEYAYATSWGVSTRLVGGVVMAHGDDIGLRLPPRLAPVQVVIIPIFRSDDEKAAVMEACELAAINLKSIRVEIDDREQFRPGYKFNEWEMKGAPIRLEIGPKELAEEHAIVYRRDLGEKSPLSLHGLDRALSLLLEEIQSNLYRQALTFREDHTYEPKSYDELRELASSAAGFIRAGWCGDRSCEEKVKEETKATIRVLPLDPIDPEVPCIVCGAKATELATWAQSY